MNRSGPGVNGGRRGGGTRVATARGITIIEV
jgi:hypothetical protein